MLGVQECSVDGCDRKPKGRGWCGKHYQRWAKFGDPLITLLDRDLTPEQRFWPKVNKNGPIPELRPKLGRCWEWTGGRSDGYGMFSLDGKQVHAHIPAYQWAKGDIPDGWQRDHLCRNRGCVNPDHLEAVPGSENMLRGVSPWAVNARKTHCPQGHLYDEANTYLYRGERHCRECARQRTRDWYHRTRSAAARTGTSDS